MWFFFECSFEPLDGLRIAFALKESCPNDVSPLCRFVSLCFSHNVPELICDHLLVVFFLSMEVEASKSHSRRPSSWLISEQYLIRLDSILPHVLLLVEVGKLKQGVLVGWIAVKGLSQVMDGLARVS